MELLPKTITRPVGRLGAAAQNALEVARFGGLETDEQPSPYEIAAEQRVYRLRHYYPAPTTRAGPPVLLVPPMMLAAEVYDVSPSDQRGHDPATSTGPTRGSSTSARPSARRGDSSGRWPTTCVGDLGRGRPGARAATGRDVHLGGYSQGGMFCYQAAAYRRNEGLSSLITFGSPVDTRAGDAVRDPRAARRPARPACSPTVVPGLGAAGLGQPDRLPAARPGQVAAQPGRVHPPAPRPRGAAAARGPAAVPRGRRLGRVAGTGDGRLPAPVHRPQPDARGRVRDRRPAA